MNRLLVPRDVADVLTRELGDLSALHETSAAAAVDLLSAAADRIAADPRRYKGMLRADVLEGLVASLRFFCAIRPRDPALRIQVVHHADYEAATDEVLAPSPTERKSAERRAALKAAMMSRNRAGWHAVATAPARQTAQPESTDDPATPAGPSVAP